jgi:nucleoside-diphosphate-sugar epimerase
MSTGKKRVKAKKTVLITGAAGFVGSSMSQRKLDQGYEVHGIDNLITGSESNVERLQKNPDFLFDRIDITDPSALLRVQKPHYDHIYHFACPTGVPNIEKYGEEMIRTCSVGTENILRIARQVKAPLVYTSSAEMYGDPQVFPQVETYNGNVDPVGARSAYEEGKRFGEAMVRLYHTKYDVEAKIVRIFNSYGPNMSRSDTRLIPNTLACIKSGKPVRIYGDGSQTRTHLFVSDLLDGLETVMRKGECASPYNVGGDKQTTINELVDAFSELLGRTLPVEYKAHFIEDHRGRQPDVSKTMALGWQASTALQTGLTAMCEAYGIDIAKSDIADQRLPQQLNVPVLAAGAT